MSNLDLLQELMSKSKKGEDWSDEAVEALAIQFAKEAAESAYLEKSVTALIMDDDDDDTYKGFDDWWEEWIEN